MGFGLQAGFSSLFVDVEYCKSLFNLDRSHIVALTQVKASG